MIGVGLTSALPGKFARLDLSARFSGTERTRWQDGATFLKGVC